eukprot:gene11299-7831_t
MFMVVEYWVSAASLLSDRLTHPSLPVVAEGACAIVKKAKKEERERKRSCDAFSIESSDGYRHAHYYNRRKNCPPPSIQIRSNQIQLESVAAAEPSPPQGPGPTAAAAAAVAPDVVPLHNHLNRRIQKLSLDVINRIAAGEVVQRPSAALKELLENAIDAGSSVIHVSCADGGLGALQVQDDGCGIDPEDFPLLCERYATSKLEAFEDLERVGTFGFRGEALASMSYVGRVVVISKQRRTASAGDRKGEEEDVRRAHAGEGGSPRAGPSPGLGWRAIFCDGRMLDSPPMQPCAANAGTTIRVEHLFASSPTRRAALKPNEEWSRLLDLVTRYALAFPHIAFSCWKENTLNTSGGGGGGGAARVGIAFPKGSTTLQNIRLAYGKTIANHLRLIYFIPEDAMPPLPPASEKRRSTEEEEGTALPMLSSATETAAWRERIQPFLFTLLATQATRDPAEGSEGASGTSLAVPGKQLPPRTQEDVLHAFRVASARVRVPSRLLVSSSYTASDSPLSSMKDMKEEEEDEKHHHSNSNRGSFLSKAQAAPLSPPPPRAFCTFAGYTSDLTLPHRSGDQSGTSGGRTSSYLSLFINHRLVEHAGIRRLVESIYSPLLNTFGSSSGQKPFTVLFLTVPGDRVDTNIHPTKKEVSLLDEDRILYHLGKLLRETVVRSAEEQQLEMMKLGKAMAAASGRGGSQITSLGGAAGRAVQRATTVAPLAGFAPATSVGRGEGGMPVNPSQLVRTDAQRGALDAFFKTGMGGGGAAASARGRAWDGAEEHDAGPRPLSTPGPAPLERKRKREAAEAAEAAEAERQGSSLPGSSSTEQIKEMERETSPSVPAGRLLNPSGAVEVPTPSQVPATAAFAVRPLHKRQSGDDDEEEDDDEADDNGISAFRAFQQAQQRGGFPIGEGEKGGTCRCSRPSTAPDAQGLKTAPDPHEQGRRSSAVADGQPAPPHPHPACDPAAFPPTAASLSSSSSLLPASEEGIEPPPPFPSPHTGAFQSVQLLSAPIEVPPPPPPPVGGYASPSARDQRHTRPSSSFCVLSSVLAIVAHLDALTTPSATMFQDKMCWVGMVNPETFLLQSDTHLLMVDAREMAREFVFQSIFRRWKELGLPREGQYRLAAGLAGARHSQNHSQERNANNAGNVIQPWRGDDSPGGGERPPPPLPPQMIALLPPLSVRLVPEGHPMPETVLFGEEEVPHECGTRRGMTTCCDSPLCIQSLLYVALAKDLAHLGTEFTLSDALLSLLTACSPPLLYASHVRTTSVKKEETASTGSLDASTAAAGGAGEGGGGGGATQESAGVRACWEGMHLEARQALVASVAKKSEELLFYRPSLESASGRSRRRASGPATRAFVQRLVRRLVRHRHLLREYFGIHITASGLLLSIPQEIGPLSLPTPVSNPTEGNPTQRPTTAGSPGPQSSSSPPPPPPRIESVWPPCVERIPLFLLCLADCVPYPSSSGGAAVDAAAGQANTTHPSSPALHKTAEKEAVDLEAARAGCEEEIRCFTAIARHLANILYGCGPPAGPRGLNQFSSSASSPPSSTVPGVGAEGGRSIAPASPLPPQSTAEDALRFGLFPCLKNKKLFRLPAACLTHGAIQHVVSVESLYKVFERC